MYSAFQLGLKYIQYYLTASNGKGHGVHSPFVFDFIINVLNSEGSYYCFHDIEKIRKIYLSADKVIEVEDFGAGSRTGATKQRAINDIAKSALKPVKYSQLLFKIATYYQPKTILELGTSLGITTAYLSNSNRDSKVLTLEGAKNIALESQQTFKTLGLQNVEQIVGNFDNTLQEALNKLQLVDFAYIDGNHRYEPTVRYYKALLPHINEDSILIFDDIHWSKEMEQAWEEIKNHEAVTLSIDLFFIGLVFFKKDFKVKKHFSIRY